MNILKNAYNAPSYLQLLINDTFNISREFNFVNFSWIPMSANSFAHQLAQFGMLVSETNKWIEYSPMFFSSILCKKLLLNVCLIFSLKKIQNNSKFLTNAWLTCKHNQSGNNPLKDRWCFFFFCLPKKFHSLLSNFNPKMKTAMTYVKSMLY